MFSYPAVQSPGRVIAVIASILLFSAGPPAVYLSAQAIAPFAGPVCQPPPSFPPVDTWPVAPTVPLGTFATPQVVTFTRAQLLPAATATAVTLVRVASTSTNGGAITGSDPFVYTTPAGFAGNDSFEYEVRNAAGEEATGVVTITVVDVTPPTVRISAPAAGAVSGIVVIAASALDNVDVASVTFFDDTTQISAALLRSPFSITWDSRLVPNGTHTLTAIARDAAGNATTSAAVVVNVVNTVATGSLGANPPRTGALD